MKFNGHRWKCDPKVDEFHKRLDCAGARSEQGKILKCGHDPEKTTGPLGMYHCPECGEMVLAGAPHPDYSLLGDCNEVKQGA
jgi:hypothetical protein